MTISKPKIVTWLMRHELKIKLALLFFASFLLFGLVSSHLESPIHSESDSNLGSLMFLIMVNLNVAVIGVLLFLIGRNLVKLIFDRKRRILGSKLKSRLVVAFVGLSLVPTAIIFLLASGLINSAIEGWFSKQVETSVQGAVKIGQNYYKWLEHQSAMNAKIIAGDVPRFAVGRRELRMYLEESRERNNLFSLRIVSMNGNTLLESHSPVSTLEDFKEPIVKTTSIENALKGKAFVLLEEEGARQFIRGYRSVNLKGKRAVLIASFRVDPQISESLANVTDSYKQYQDLKYFKQPLKSGYTLTLAMFTGLIIFSAIWLAFYMAREIAVPIQKLAEGTRKVAKGDYDFQLDVGGDDEIGYLVESFNTMTADLKASRLESESRRIYLETILSNLVVGVVAVDKEDCATLVNKAAGSLLDFQPGEAVLGKKLSDFINEGFYPEIKALISELSTGEEVKLAQREILVMKSGRQTKIFCTAGVLADKQGRVHGTVLLLDDITELSVAHSMSAWREVAKRIAHEIKNPLTPIQLSAQRLQRFFAGRDVDPAVLECSQTIVEHVDSIKRLANEFSNFARMPTAEFKPTNLNSLITDTISPYAENHNDLVFQFVADNSIPEVSLDPEQIRRLIINLVENAIDAMRNQVGIGMNSRIVVKTSWDRLERTASFEISDTGPGIRDEDKPRIFEPYYTTKNDGTGLGLAIVTSIVRDHEGQIRVVDNTPQGARFIVDLPLTPRPSQRRVAA